MYEIREKKVRGYFKKGGLIRNDILQGTKLCQRTGHTKIWKGDLSQDRWHLKGDSTEFEFYSKNDWKSLNA